MSADLHERHPMTDDIARICRLAPVIPVVVIEREEDAVPLARALLDGELKVIEVTLRTPAALPAIRRIAREVPGVVVGAGTILSAGDLRAAREAGALFGVSPGTPPGLLEAIRAASWPFLPGAATPTEALALREQGFHVLKFFPAEPAGGAAMLKAMHGPMPDLSFCPTGGIDEAGTADYLGLPNVICVGGSWVTPASAVRAGDFAAVKALAARAAALRPVP